MCNRYTLDVKLERLRRAFLIDRLEFRPDGDIVRAEFFPGSAVPVLRQGPDPGSRELTEAAWGIDLYGRSVTNSRDDKADTTWRRFVERRVVFPVSKAIEYRYPLDLVGQPIVKRGASRPWALSAADGTVAAVAGIAGPDMRTVSMFTTRGTGLYAQVHNKKPDDPRMLVYLTEPGDVDAWLDPGRSFGDVRQLLRPAPDGYLAAVEL